MLYYNVGDKSAIMYAYIDGNGRATACSENKDRYWTNTGYYDPKISEPVLEELIRLASHQVIEDYKLSLVANDYKSFLNENQKTEDN